MNGARSTYMRKGYLLTALAAAVLLAASSGTALAQTVEIDSLTLASSSVDEGGQATATMKFTVMAGDENDLPTGNATVGFGYHLADLTTGPMATNAGTTSFYGLTADTTSNVQNVPVSLLREGRERQYTVTHTFGANHDLDAETGQFKLQGSVRGIGTEVTTMGASRYLIDDDEIQTYTLSIPSGFKGAIDEGNTTGAMVTLTADPGRSVDGTVPDFTVVREPSGSGYTFTPEIMVSDLVATNAGARAMGTIGSITAAIDKNRVDDTVTVKLYSGTIGNALVVTELAITVTDIHKLAAPDHITAVAKDEDGNTVTEIVEGAEDPVYLTITVDRGTGSTKDLTTGEELTVDIRANSAQGGDFEVEPARVTLDSKDSGKSVTDVDIMLNALTDEDVGLEDLVLQLVVSGETARGSGTSTGTFSIAIVDETMTKVAPKAEADAYPTIMAAMEAGAGEDGLNPGESFSVMTSDLFTVAEGYTAAYGASVQGNGVSVSASGDTITVDAKSATGEEPAKVTVTATAKMAASSFIPSQTVSNIADITFPVTVVDTPLMVTVSADPMEIDEGGTSMITATANRYVTAGDGDVEIDLVVVGGGELDADSIMIAMGAMSGSAMLTATEDDDMADETVTVVATGSGIDVPMQVMIAVTDNDDDTVEPVPALPLIGQLLLALFMMVGGARLYRRRQG